METLDNPSYFSLPANVVRPQVRSLRRSTPTLPRFVKMGSTSSCSNFSSSPTNIQQQQQQNRRSFRSLLRSLSGPSVHVKDHQLEMLGPAPSTPSDVSETDFSNTDMMYYNVPSIMARKPKDNDETPPKYYHNISDGLGRRRHSIGAFFKERAPIGANAMPFHRLDVNANFSPSSKFVHERRPSAERWPQQGTRPSAERWPQQGARPSAERWPHQGARRRCQRNSITKGARAVDTSPMLRAAGAAEMDDILIISYQQSQVANLWVDYIKSCFNEICTQRKRPPFKILCKGLEDITGALTLPLEEHIVRVKMQLVVICPQFLQHIQEHPERPGAALARLLQPNRVLAMLLGVEEAAITDEHRVALASYDQWKRLPVRNKDEAFVGEFLSEAMALLARVTKELQEARQEKAAFSVLPKKVKHGHNKVIVLLNEPLDKDDKIKISVNKNGEILEVAAVKRRNPFTLHFSMPDACLAISMLAGVRVEKNGELLGCRQIKCESKMRELDQLLRSSDNPLDFMCQTLGFNGDREQLDSFLVTAFQRNLPQHFDLFRLPAQDGPHRSSNCGEELPTLLHFAAKFGLEKLSWQLLECPGGEQACEMRNVNDLTPADIADKAGHEKLATAFRGYMQMNEFTNMYCYLKSVAEGKSTKAPSMNGSDVVEEADYHRPRPPSETYQVPPSPRPVTVTTPTSDDTGGYLEMHPSLGGRRSPALSTGASSLQRRSPKCDNFEGASIELTAFNYQARGNPPSLPGARSKEILPNGSQSRGNEEESRKLHSAGKGRKSSREHLPNASVQDELVEIISDFKNNVFTISEVEKLVESWRNRNDVQQSFKEKQDQLKEMRQEYERLQQQMKVDMKAATPFDRIKKWFKSSKTKESENKEATTEERRPLNLNLAERVSDVVQRPASSLSVQSVSSSSSSERMSTMSALSACSLGDSGTHSDPEDHKMLAPLREPPHIEEGSTEVQLPNYSVPPSCPRPFKTAKPKFGRSPGPSSYSLDTRPPMPAPRPYDDDNNSYIQPGEYNDEDQYFEPQGPAVTQEGAASMEYMNLVPPCHGNLPNYLNLCQDAVLAAPPVPPRVHPRNAE